MPARPTSQAPRPSSQVPRQPPRAAPATRYPVPPPRPPSASPGPAACVPASSLEHTTTGAPRPPARPPGARPPASTRPPMPWATPRRGSVHDHGQDHLGHAHQARNRAPQLKTRAPEPAKEPRFEPGGRPSDGESPFCTFPPPGPRDHGHRAARPRPGRPASLGQGSPPARPPHEASSRLRPDRRHGHRGPGRRPNAARRACLSAARAWKWAPGRAGSPPADRYPVPAGPVATWQGRPWPSSRAGSTPEGQPGPGPARPRPARARP